MHIRVPWSAVSVKLLGSYHIFSILYSFQSLRNVGEMCEWIVHLINNLECVLHLVYRYRYISILIYKSNQYRIKKFPQHYFQKCLRDKEFEQETQELLKYRILGTLNSNSFVTYREYPAQDSLFCSSKISMLGCGYIFPILQSFWSFRICRRKKKCRSY